MHGKVDGRKYQRRMCHPNSYYFAVKTGAKLIEGYAYVKGVPIGIEHSWNELNGMFVDTTLRDDDGKPLLCSIPDDYAFFGAEVSMEQRMEYMRAHGVHGAVVFDWICGYPLAHEGREHREF